MCGLRYIMVRYAKLYTMLNTTKIADNLLNIL
jgi:hypothetical protein